MYKNRRSFDRPTNKKLISGNQSGKEKIRRLSTVPEMASDGEEELVSGTAIHRKLKFPREIFGDLNTIDPVSVVPRKLRSAIRKRSCGSTLLPLHDGKRSNSFENGVETLRKDGFKKSKLSMQKSCQDHSREQSRSAPISADEMEVAETLFALAGLIPLSELQAKNKMEENDEDSITVSRVPKDAQAVATISMTNSQENSLIGPKLSERRPMNRNLRVSVPHLTQQKISHFLKTCDQQASMTNPTFFHTLSISSIENGLNEFKQDRAFIPNRESLVRNEAVEVENQHATEVEKRHNGVSVTSRVLHDSGIYGLHLQSSATIYPSWLSTTTSSSADKLSCSMSDRSSWKRCLVHVHISRLIKALQTSEEKETRHSNSSRGKLDGKLTNTIMLSSSDCKDSHEGANVTSVNHKHHQEQKHEGSSLSGCGVSKKQSFDFLSLSSRVTPSSEKGYLIYEHSAVHHGRTTIPFSLQQNYLPSYRVCDQVSVGLPPTALQGHSSNPFAPGHMMMTSAPQQEPKQEIWTDELAAQFRPGPQLASHITNWQKRRKDLHSSSTQAFPEEVRAKYPHFSQQQRLPSIREDNGNQLRVDGVLTL